MAALARMVVIVLTSVILAVLSIEVIENRSENTVSPVVENKFRGNFKPWRKPKRNKTQSDIIKAENEAYENLKDEIQQYRDNYNKTKTFFIFPGTKWCGAGDIAANYDDLGVFRSVDMCCRDHDHCPDYIEAFASKYGLSNFSPIGKLLCSCDQKLLNCLQNVNSTASLAVGDIYFNVLGSQCFKEDYPIVKCKKYYTTILNRCEQYDQDTRKAKKYQYFDVPPYN